jgi:sirohydrochlorin cobaltochelatase
VTTRGIVLFAHGARDARWAEPFLRLKARIEQREPATPVGLAFLEMMEPGLAEACAGLVAQGCTELLVVPVFLGQGGHVREDLPRQLLAVRQSHPEVVIRATDAAGEDAAVIDALAQFCLAQFASVNS